MKRNQRFKLGAGAGLVTMLLGALMVLAPSAASAAADRAGNPDCSVLLGELGYTAIQEAKFEQGSDTVAPFPSADEDEFQLVSGDFDVEFRLGSDGVTFKGATADIYLVSIKKGSDGQDFSVVEVFDGVRSGFVAYDEGSFSNIKFCSGTPPTTPRYGSFTLDKELAGNLAPTTDPAFEFTIDCGAVDIGDDGADDTDLVVNINATDPAWDSDDELTVDLSVDTVCSIEETAVPGATTTYKVNGGTVTPGEDGAISVTIGDAAQVVVVTNDYGNDQTPRTGGLSLDKNVLGANPGAGTLYGFSINCAGVDLDPQNPNETKAVVTLTAGAAPLVYQDLPSDTVCTVNETNAQGASSTTYSIAGGVVTIVAGQTTPLVVTNTFNSVVETPDDASLTIVKEWAEAPVGDWDVDFRGDLGQFELTDDAPSKLFADVEPGTYVIREAASADHDLVGVECTGATVEDLINGVRVTVVAEAAVICTFENVVIEEQVLPDEETPPVVTPPVVTPPVVTPPAVVPVAQPQAQKPQVLGAQTVRALPRTGDETRGLAGAGVFLLALGVAMVLGSKRRYAQD